MSDFTLKDYCNTCTHSNEIDGSNCYECVKGMHNNYEPTTKNDLGVDWDELKRKIFMEVDGGTDDKWLRYVDVCENISKSIDEFKADLPPATPIRPKGHWIVQPSNKEQDERDFIWWKCSECGQVIFSETEKDRREFHAFCSKCGADMREVEE